MKGLEPPRLSALDPKSSAATNYATSATLIPDAPHAIAGDQIKHVRNFLPGRRKGIIFWPFLLSNLKPF